jgi:predicted nucleic acid-binding protein
MIRAKKIELAWSYILEFENAANPFFERRYTIEKWKALSIIDIEENEIVLSTANNFYRRGLKAKDALHIGCAIETGCEYFLTTDDVIVKKMKNISEIGVLNPIEFISLIEEL